MVGIEGGDGGGGEGKGGVEGVGINFHWGKLALEGAICLSALWGDNK